MVLIKIILSVSIFTCFWSSLIIAKNDRKLKLVHQLKSLQKSHTLFRMKNPVMDENTMMKMKLGDLNDHISNEYRRIQCSYMISCIYFLNTARGLFLLSDEDKSKVNMTDLLKDISFKTTATYMLASLKNEEYLKKGINEILWIFYIYFERFTDKLEKAKTTKDLTVLLPSHDAVTKLFELAFESNKCFELSHPEDDVRFDVVKKIGKSSTNMEKKLKDFVKLKKEVNDQLQHNHDNCDIKITDHLFFDIIKLRLINVLMDSILIKNLQVVFGLMEDWTEFITTNMLSESFKCDNQNPSLYDTIQSIGQLLFNFIQLLKAIMLRICLEFLECMKNENVFKRSYDKICPLVTDDFIPLLHLQEDKDMEDLISVLRPYSTKTFDSRIKTVKGILSRIKTKPDIDYTKNLINNEDEEKSLAELLTLAEDQGFNQTIIIKTLPKQVWRAKLYVQYIKKKLVMTIDFQTILWFIKVKDSIEVEILRTLEEDQSTLISA